MTPHWKSLGALRLAAPMALVIASAIPSAAQLAASAWPISQHDLQHTGRSTFSGPTNEPDSCWEYQGGGRNASPSLAPDGTIYLTVGRRPIVALDPSDGSELWPDTPGQVAIADRSQPAVDQSGEIYVGLRNNSLWAFKPNGDFDWDFHVNTDGDVSTSPAIGPDGTIYMGSDSLGAGRLYAVHPNSTQKWLTVLGAGIKNVSPALSHDNQTLYVTTEGRTLHALNASNGTVLWSRNVGTASAGSRAFNYSPAVGSDGTIYFAARVGVFAFSPAGTQLWGFQPASRRFASAPALAADGTIYAGAWGTGGADLYALNKADGSVKWDRPLLTGGKLRNSQPVVGFDGTIYLGHNRFLYSFAPADGSINWFKPLQGSIQSGPVIPSNGLIYAGAGTRLYALSDQPYP